MHSCLSSWGHLADIGTLMKRAFRVPTSVGLFLDSESHHPSQAALTRRSGEIPPCGSRWPPLVNAHPTVPVRSVPPCGSRWVPLANAHATVLVRSASCLLV